MFASSRNLVKYFFRLSLKALITIAALAVVSASNAQIRVSNPVLSIGISGNWGGAIDSVQVLGYEVVNAADTGREIQSAVYFNTSNTGFYCGQDTPPWYAPSEAGDICNNKSPIYAIGADTTNLHVGVYPLDWAGRGQQPQGLQIEGHHQIGPLPYSNHNEVARLGWRFLNYTGGSLNFMPDNPPVVACGLLPVPVPLLPAVYFDDSRLTRLFGLRMDSAWEEVSPYQASNGGDYCPSKYYYKAMAWMLPDLGWGVALYSRDTLNQAINFVAEEFPCCGTNNLSVVNQSIGVLADGAYVDRSLHLVVGNLGTIQAFVDELYSNGY